MPDLYDLLALLRAYAAFFSLLEDALHYALGLRGALVYVYGEDAGLVLRMEMVLGRGLHDHRGAFGPVDDVLHRTVWCLLGGLLLHLHIRLHNANAVVCVFGAGD